MLGFLSINYYYLFIFKETLSLLLNINQNLFNLFKSYYLDWFFNICLILWFKKIHINLKVPMNNKLLICSHIGLDQFGWDNSNIMLILPYTILFLVLPSQKLKLSMQHQLKWKILEFQVKVNTTMILQKRFIKSRRVKMWNIALSPSSQIVSLKTSIEIFIFIGCKTAHNELKGICKVFLHNPLNISIFVMVFFNVVYFTHFYKLEYLLYFN